MHKSPDAFRTISEVAQELDLPQHVLRFWETRFSQIKPMKRGGGRRYYRPDDVELLRGIRHLLYSEGYTIKGVQRILKENGVRYVIDYIEQIIEQEASTHRDLEKDESEESGALSSSEQEKAVAEIGHQGQEDQSTSSQKQISFSPDVVLGIATPKTPREPVLDETKEQLDPPIVKRPVESPETPKQNIASEESRNARIVEVFSSRKAAQETLLHEADNHVHQVEDKTEPEPDVRAPVLTSAPTIADEKVLRHGADPIPAQKTENLRKAKSQDASQPSQKETAEAVPKEQAPIQAPAPAQTPAPTHADHPDYFAKTSASSVMTIQSVQEYQRQETRSHGFMSRFRRNSDEDGMQTLRQDEKTKGGLSPDDVRRLQSTLFELLECKRLLDQARED